MDEAAATGEAAFPSDAASGCDKGERHLAMLRAYLSDHWVGCPMCGYELGGLTSDRCPECGERLVLRLFPAEPKMRLWVAGLIALAGGAGFHGIVFAWGSVVNLLGDFPPGWVQIFRLSGGGVIDCVALALWLMRGRWVRRLRLRDRVVLTVGAWVMVGAIAAVSFSLVGP